MSVLSIFTNMATYNSLLVLKKYIETVQKEYSLIIYVQDIVCCYLHHMFV